ncbi:adenosine deaminase [Alternaria panax]|uniref:Adenosine deaminase n=1 Tax=Alternaria panax TaxID=48097 RepID=A0AAD4NQ34_9PLEO|nr:adenosine deaminase [Alternaria panax]
MSTQPSTAAHLPVDAAFTKGLPKIEVLLQPPWFRVKAPSDAQTSVRRIANPATQLHAHLTGSISRECLHDIWETKKARDSALDLDDPLVAIPTGKVDYDIKTRSTKAVLQDFQDDGLVYVELRTTPRAIPVENVTKDDYVKTVLEILKAHNDDAHNTMRAFLILSIDRRNTIAEAEEVIDLAIKYQSAGVVGVDLCGDPAKGNVRIFGDSFARAKAAGLKITLHFAESEPSSSELELQTLLSWQPDRLGHVIHVKEEFRKTIEQHEIGVELCLSCNVHAKMITGTYSDHHFGIWRHSSVPVALSTDDVGVFCSPLSEEYLLAAQHFNLNRNDIRSLCERAIDSIFTGPDEHERLKKIYASWEGWNVVALVHDVPANFAKDKEVVWTTTFKEARDNQLINTNTSFDRTCLGFDPNQHPYAREFNGNEAVDLATTFCEDTINDWDEANPDPTYRSTYVPDDMLTEPKFTACRDVDATLIIVPPSLLQTCEEQLRHIIFTFWSSTLNLIEKGLLRASITFTRYDGNTTPTNRSKALNNFRRDPNISIILMTISCAAVGLNITTANRAYIMEPQWNRTVEEQALACVHRMGETKEVTTIRFVMADTFEEARVRFWSSWSHSLMSGRGS